MNSKYIGWVVAAFAIAALGLVLLKDGPKNQKAPEAGSGATLEKVAEIATNKIENVKAPDPTTPDKHPSKKEAGSVTVEDVGRLPKERIITSVFETSGKGESASWGLKKLASFHLTAVIDAKSRLISQETTEGGLIHVVEERTFTKAVETLNINSADVQVDLSTTPLNQISDFVSGVSSVAGGIVSCFFGPEVGASVAAGARAFGAGVKWLEKNLNGKGLKDLGVDFSPVAQTYADESFGKVQAMVRSVQGKSYRIEYCQKASGQPLYVCWTHADGSPVETEEENYILDRVNAFIDAGFLPDNPSEYKPGSTWTIETRDLGELFDGNGVSVKGPLQVHYDANDEKGNWCLKLVPGSISALDERGSTIGAIAVTGGNASVSPDGRYLQTAQFSGKGFMRKVNKHSLLFFEFGDRIGGECQFRGTLKSQVVQP